VRWELLDESTRARLKAVGVVNGCGGKGSWFDPPDWHAESSCDAHDLDYAVGGNELDRREADWRFRASMLATARLLPWWTRWLGVIQAFAYFAAVRLWATPYFRYRGASEAPPTTEDLVQEAKGHRGGRRC